jgi:RNA polymerase sigma-70 factor (ECF subfamily)
VRRPRRGPSLPGGAGLSTTAAVERIYREEYGRIVATLVRRFGNIDIAEDAAAEALLAAVEKWPVDGVPPNPGGWLTTTAGNRAIDRLRRESHRDAKYQAAQMITDDTPHEPTGVVEDDRLRLIFTCCHPALAAEARVALTLRLLGGLTVAEIAQAFLVQETTMAQRITRAKKKISAARIPYRVPEPADLPARVAAVLAVVYLVFNEGYLSSSGEAPPIREELTAEAIRLGRILHTLLPDDQEVAGLLALMLMTEARRPARVAAGELVPLHEQDRGGWDRELIAEGHAIVRECLRRNRPGQYQLLAAINAVHTDAPTAADTDWGQIATLYERLYAIAPTPVVALNRAVAVAELDGPEVALATVDRLPLASYHAWHATRADLLRRLGRSAEAREAYDAAIALTDNGAEQAYLSRRRGSLAP